jgi:hypothetical protein
MTAPAPDTVTEAVAFLTAEGYRDELRLGPGGLLCDSADNAHGLDTAVVDYTFRFEGNTDPADEAIVLGIRCPDWGVKGILVSAFGPEIDPEHAEALRALVRHH